MVLYTPPNPNGTRKSCQNCMQWMPGDNQCWLMDDDVVVPAEGICGYHLFGRPSVGQDNGENTRRPEMQLVEPENAGFDHIAGGVSCDTCLHYEGYSLREGKCAIVVDPDTGTSLTVESLACCTFWTSRDA
jgi:hypothetical protein